MLWADFREEYSRLKVPTFRSEDAKESAEYRLDICQRIAKPSTLGDMADNDRLAKLQAELLAGTESRKGKRAPSTVQSYMSALRAALNWAHRPMGWLPNAFTFDLLNVDEDDAAKGRPLTLAEFQRMLKACDEVCKSDPGSWKFLLSGLWESGLRLSEIMLVHWSDPTFILPLRHKGGGHLLQIPANCQKSRKSETIPTTPEFAAVLDEVPNEQRDGWIFNPAPLRTWPHRLTSDQVGRIVSDIGKKADIVVKVADDSEESDKYASAHDLRRSFGQRMADAGVTRQDLQAIMRHKDYKTTERYYIRHRAEEQAKRIAEKLQANQGTDQGTPAKSDAQKETAEMAVSPCED